MPWRARAKSARSTPPILAARETAERAELGAASRSEVEQAIEDLRSVFDTFFLSQAAGLEPE
jgi:hypothetical protein